MPAALALFAFLFVVSVLYTSRTPFWWLARFCEALDLGCRVGWRAAVLFRKRWQRDVRVLMASRKEETA